MKADNMFERLGYTKQYEDETVPEKLNRMIEFLEKWNENITIIPEDKKYLVEIKNLIENQ